MVMHKVGHKSNREGEKMTNIPFEAIVCLMDDEIREEVHMELAPCTDAEFLEAYREKHFAKYGEEFTIN